MCVFTQKSIPWFVYVECAKWTIAAASAIMAALPGRQNNNDAIVTDNINSL